MKKIFILFVCSFVSLSAYGVFSCGDGFALVESKRVDGMDAFECQRIWCMDLETGKYMGNGNKANSGYVLAGPNELCDKTGSCVECFGERKWCAGERTGYWNAEYGAYTYNGDDNATYSSYQKGSCFGWRLEKPDCADDQVAVLDGDRYVCLTRETTPDTVKASSIRRTTSIRKLPK